MDRTAVALHHSLFFKTVAESMKAFNTLDSKQDCKTNDPVISGKCTALLANSRFTAVLTDGNRRCLTSGCS